MSRLHSTRPLLLLALAVALALAGAFPAESPAVRPPVTWLKGEGNYTKAHRGPQTIKRIVVHVTEGSFWGSVQWLKNPRAHASSHFIVSRRGKIVQLVHVSDIAWHAGHWGTNAQSVGIEHEGFTYGPHGFTDAQYESSAKLTAWLARRALMPIDRRHIIGHHEVPAPGGGFGGASRHTDPGPRWNWRRYLQLVRSFAGTQAPFKITDNGIKREQVVSGRLPWRVQTTAAVRRLEFVIDRRVRWVDRTPPFTFGPGRGFDTLRLSNGRHLVELMAYDGRGKRTVQRYPIVVRNQPFVLQTTGAAAWTRVRGVVPLRAAASGPKVARVVFKVDGRRVLVDRTAPYGLLWDTRRLRDGRHVLEVVAHSVDGRVTSRRFPVVVRNAPPKPAPKPAPPPAPRPTPPPPPPPPKPAPPPPPVLRILSQSLVEGQLVEGLVVWRVEATGAPVRVVFLVDGVGRGADVARPYTFGWDTTAETPGPHRLTARAVGAGGKLVERSITVTVPEPPATAGSAAP